MTDPRWQVVQAFFQERGLVRQQLDSFDDFISHGLQDAISTTAPINVNEAIGHEQESESVVGPPFWEFDPINKAYSLSQQRLHIVEFGKISMSRPTITESDGTVEPLLPRDARLRNLTYASSIYLEMRKITKVSRTSKSNPNGPIWSDEDVSVPFQKILLGRLPIMIKSQVCSLRALNDKELMAVGECPYDDGGYFIVTGSEKVLIAQERMAANYVYVFPKAPPSSFTHVAEVRSQSGSRHMATLYMKLMGSRSGEKGVIGQPVRLSLPYIKVDVPLMILFRALGFHDDEVLALVKQELADEEAVQSMVQPSLEEAADYPDLASCLEYIGKRAMNPISNKDRRTRYAKDIVTRELLPHVDTVEGKGWYLCYMLMRLYDVAAGRQPPDDRDHFGKKRLDMAGPLLGSMFRSLFKKLTKDMGKALQRVSSDSFDPDPGKPI